MREEISKLLRVRDNLVEELKKKKQSLLEVKNRDNWDDERENLNIKIFRINSRVQSLEEEIKKNTELFA